MSDADFDRPVTPPRSPTPPSQMAPQPSTSTAPRYPSLTESFYASIATATYSSTPTARPVPTYASTPMASYEFAPARISIDYASTSTGTFAPASTTTFAPTSTVAFAHASTSAFETSPTSAFVSTSTPAFESTSAEAFPSTSTAPYDTAPTVKFESNAAFVSTSTEAFPSTSAEAFPSTSTEAFPSTSTDVYPSTSTDVYPSTSAEAFPSTSTRAFESTHSTTFESTSTEAFPSTSTATFGDTSADNYASTSTYESTYADTSADDSACASTVGPSRGKKRRSWDPSSDYEIERIVGYHRDKDEMMWYFVKWKGWPEEYNTYEPIENMTGCNFLLMKFFEFKKPSGKEFTKKDNEITASLETYDVYLKLVESSFKKEDLDDFSENCVNISKMFKKGSFVNFCKTMQKEYEYIIRCLIGMCSHQDPGLIRRAKNYKIVLKMIKLRRKQLRENLAMQNYISSLEATEVKIENYTDLDIFPQSLTYVVDLKLGENVVMPNDPTVGCDCEGGCNPKSRCCGEMASTLFAYNRYGRVRSLERFAIYECNRRCKCPPECPNRIVQHGMKVKLCIFKTEKCGWGVKALERIPKGTFICEYVGELITDAEAVVRDIEYYKKNSSYVFDLDYSPDHEKNMCCIDATKYGNLARFINHSCDPNLVVYPVWIDCLEPNLHRLAFFARRNIKKDEELSIDYENAQDGQVPQLSKEEEDKRSQRPLRTLSRIRCQCGAPKCREWVFGN